MRGVVVDKPGASAVVIDNLGKPEPADDQVLVKSIYTALNPVDSFMASTGLLVVDWPLVLGCDAAGVIVKTGSNAVGPLGPLKVGDEVTGCTRLGIKGHSTCQEYFLMDAALATPKPKNISIAQAATVGVGFYTACLGIFNGLHIAVPHPEQLPAPSGDWVLVAGGASSVGKYAVQLLKGLGFNVLATSSSKSSSVLSSIGVNVRVDYKKPQEEQIAELLSHSGGALTRIFDAVGTNEQLAKEIFKQVSANPKYFSTTNDWVPMPEEDFSGGKVYPCRLGPIGRPDAPELNKNVESFIPLMVKLIEDGKVVPSGYEVIGEPGFKSVIEAWAYQQSGAAGSNKVLVNLQGA